MKEKQKVTIYVTSEFFGSVQSREGYLIEHGTKKYAQYSNAPYVQYIPKGKRKIVGFVKGYKPYLLIVNGWNLPKSQGMFENSITNKDNVTIKKSTYSCFDDRYKSDFDVIINQYKHLFVADYRIN